MKNTVERYPEDEETDMDFAENNDTNKHIKMNGGPATLTVNCDEKNHI